MVELIWDGKKEMLEMVNDKDFLKSDKKIIPDKESSKNWENTENLYIEGDNLDALKLLYNEYQNKIKMIYIDPPYNTEKKFAYNDTFRNKRKKECRHSGWLNMMYPRLRVAKDLLTDDGVIFISIDDNEVDNLKKICDEIFGENNFEADFHIKVRHEKRILREDIRYQLVMEHILCYKKSTYVPNRLPKDKNSDDDYIYDIVIEDNPREVTKIGDYSVEIFSKESYKILKKEKGSGQFKKYQIRGSLISQKGSASEYYELNLRERRELDGEATLYKIIGMGEKGDGLGYRYIMQPDNYNNKNGFYFQGRPLVKNDNKGLPYPNFYDFVLETNNVGYEGNVEFKNGKKPIKLILKIFNISAITHDKESIVLDFFSGSATTAHATMQLNAEDGGNRKCIMVQLPENCDEKSEAYKAGYKNICEIGKERIRRAGDKILEENKDKEGIENLDIGFKVFKLE